TSQSVLASHLPSVALSRAEHRSRQIACRRRNSSKLAEMHLIHIFWKFLSGKCRREGDNGRARVVQRRTRMERKRVVRNLAPVLIFLEKAVEIKAGQLRQSVKDFADRRVKRAL